MGRVSLASIAAVLLAAPAAGCVTTDGDIDVATPAGPPPVTATRDAEAPSPPPFVPSERERTIVRLVNEARVAEGLPPLALDDRLGRVARDFAGRMANERFFDHVDPEGGDLVDRLDAQAYPYAMAGENIAAGRESAAGTMGDWMTSDGHRRNILSPKATQLGVGHVRYEGRPGEPLHRHYWVMVVGRER